MNTPDLTADQRRRVERMRDAVPFLKLLGIEVESVGPGTATLLLPVRQELTRNDGIIHGGAIASVIDSAFAFAIVPVLAENERTVTVDLTIHYLASERRHVENSRARGARRPPRNHSFSRTL